MLVVIAKQNRIRSDPIQSNLINVPNIIPPPPPPPTTPPPPPPYILLHELHRPKRHWLHDSRIFKACDKVVEEYGQASKQESRSQQDSSDHRASLATGAALLLLRRRSK